MITIEEVLKNINLASIPAIEEIGKQIADLWKEARQNDSADDTPGNAAISLSDITTLWNRLTDASEKTSATHSDRNLSDATTKLLAVTAESISSIRNTHESEGANEIHSSESVGQSTARELVKYLSESMSSAYTAASSACEALRSESAQSTSASMANVRDFTRDISSVAFGDRSESLTSLEEIRETLTNALGLESQQTSQATHSAMTSRANSERLLFNAMLPPENAMLSRPAFSAGGDPRANAPTNVTMSGIAITVNGNDGEAIANGIANSLVAKTQQAYMGDGSVGR